MSLGGGGDGGVMTIMVDGKPEERAYVCEQALLGSLPVWRKQPVLKDDELLIEPIGQDPFIVKCRRVGHPDGLPGPCRERHHCTLGTCTYPRCRY